MIFLTEKIYLEQISYMLQIVSLSVSFPFLSASSFYDRYKIDYKYTLFISYSF